MATIRPDPGRQRDSQMYCFGSVAIEWWLCLQQQATEAPQKLEQLRTVPLLTFKTEKEIPSPYLSRFIKEGHIIQHIKPPPGRKACNYHLSMKLLQFVCLLTGTLNGLESIFNTIQPVFTVGLLKGNNITARTRQRLRVGTVVFIQQCSPTWTHLFKQHWLVTDCYIPKEPNTRGEHLIPYYWIMYLSSIENILNLFCVQQRRNMKTSPKRSSFFLLFPDTQNFKSSCPPSPPTDYSN